MGSLTAGKRRTSRRVAAGLVLLAAAAPAAAVAASASARHGSAHIAISQPVVHSGSGTVHAYVDRSGTVVVSGYDGGAALEPSGVGAGR